MAASFFIIMGLALWILLAFIPAILAKKKGYSFLLFLILSWFVSFLITLLVVLVLRNKNETAQDRADERAAQAALEREERQAMKGKS